MSDNLTAELQAIKDRADNATEGPWFSTYLGNVTSRAGLLRWVTPLQDDEDEPLLANDAAFISQARTDIPKLLKVIERLIEQRDSLIEMNEDDEEFVIAGTKSYANAELSEILRGEK